jgi:ankyrin repeat protein
LSSATAAGNLDIVEFLIGNNMPINRFSNMGANGPLHEAAFHGQTNVVDFLLRHGAMVDQFGNMGLTPLMCSAKEGYLETSRLLFANGARLTRTEAGLDTLTLACIRGRLEVVRWLIDVGAPTEVVWIQELIVDGGHEPHQAEIVNLLLDNGAPSDYVTWAQMSALCVRLERLEILNVLLERVSDINSSSTERHTPLAVALDLGETNVAKVLLDRGADPTVSHGTKNLWRCCRGRNRKCPYPKTFAGKSGH